MEEERDTLKPSPPPRPCAREGIISSWALSEAGGRGETILGERFPKKWIPLNFFKKSLLLCLFLLFPPPQLQTLVKLNSFEHPTVLESNFSFFFDHSILKWGTKCSSQTWCVRSSFFCLSRQYRACFLLQGKCARTQWEGRALREPMVPGLGQPADLCKGSEFKIPGSRTHGWRYQCLFCGLPLLRSSSFCQGQRPSPNLNKHKDQNPRRPPSYVTSPMKAASEYNSSIGFLIYKRGITVPLSQGWCPNLMSHLINSGPIPPSGPQFPSTAVLRMPSSQGC